MKRSNQNLHSVQLPILVLLLVISLPTSHAQSKNTKAPKLTPKLSKDAQVAQELREKLEKTEAAKTKAESDAQAAEAAKSKAESEKSKAEAELARLKAIHEPQSVAPPEGVRYFCSRTNANGQAGHLRNLKMRVRNDVSFSADTILNENWCDYFDTQPGWCLSDKPRSEAMADGAKGFVVKAGREVLIPSLRWEYIGGYDSYKLPVVDAGNILKGFRAPSLAASNAVGLTRSARDFKEALEALTGMELITKIEDRCDPPIEVKKAPAERRSKDGIQEKLHNQSPSADEIKGNSAERGA